MDAEAPIGVFDSGVGGLTVLRTLLRRLPDEHTVYLGDTAINLADLGPKMKAIKEAKAGSAAADNNVVYIRGDRDACYTDMMKVLGLARDAGYRANIVIVPEQGS